MKLFEYLFGFLVFTPRVPLPHRFLGRRVPRMVRPSPPPYGWSTGFIADPRTVGRIPIQRERPALPITTRLCSSLDTCPTFAHALSEILRVSLAGSFIVTYPASCASTTAKDPADRTNTALPSGYTETLYTKVPTGRFLSGSRLPGRRGAGAEIVISRPGRASFG